MERRKPGLCAHDGCGIYGPLSKPGDKRRFCLGHAQGDMMNIHNKKCQASGCSKQPVFGKEGQQASMCATHKSNGMRNVKNRTCADPSCMKQPSYGFSGEAKKFCAPHKLDGMINIRSQHSRRCSFPACTRFPLSGFPGGTNRRCSRHQEEGMIAGPTRQVGENRSAKSGEQSAKPVVSPAAASDESYDNTVEAARDGGTRPKRKRVAETPTPAYATAPNDAENSVSLTAAGECGEATSGEAKAKLPKTPSGLKDETTFAAGDLVAGAGDSGAAASSRVVTDNDQSKGRGSQNSGGKGTLRGLAVGSSQRGATVVSGKASAKPMASPRGTQEVDAIDGCPPFSLPVTDVRRGSGVDGRSQRGATVVSGTASAKPMASPRGTQQVDAIDGCAPFSLPVTAVRRGSVGNGSPPPVAASHSGFAGRTRDKADGGDGVEGASSSRTSAVTGKWRGKGCLSSLKARCSQKL